MLCLTKREGDRIRIGDDIVVVVNKIYLHECGAAQVQLAIEAPRRVRITRDEMGEIADRCDPQQ